MTKERPDGGGPGSGTKEMNLPNVMSPPKGCRPSGRNREDRKKKLASENGRGREAVLGLHHQLKDSEDSV